MTPAGTSAGRGSEDYRSTSPRRSGTRRSSGASDSDVTADIAAQIGEAAHQLGSRLADPSTPHTVDELEAVTQGFSHTVAGMAEGLAGITEWLRAAGYAGRLSGHCCVVGERLTHLSKELHRLSEAIREEN